MSDPKKKEELLFGIPVRGTAMSYTPAKASAEIFTESHDDVVDALALAVKVMKPKPYDPGIKLSFAGKPLTYEDMKAGIETIPGFTPEDRREMKRAAEEEKLRKELAELRKAETASGRFIDIDKAAGLLAMTRSPGETDDQLRTRIKTMLNQVALDAETENAIETMRATGFSTATAKPATTPGTMSDHQLQRALRHLRYPEMVVDIDGVEHAFKKVSPERYSRLTDRVWDYTAQNVMRLAEAFKNVEIHVPEKAAWPMIVATRGPTEAIMFPRDAKKAELAMAIVRSDNVRDGELYFVGDDRSGYRARGVFHVDNFIRYCLKGGLKDWIDAMLNPPHVGDLILEDVGVLRVTAIHMPDWMMSLTDDMMKASYGGIPVYQHGGDIVQMYIQFDDVKTYLDFPVRGVDDA